MQNAETILVDLGARAYEIEVGVGGLSRLGEGCCARFRSRSCLVVTDAHVAQAGHLAKAVASLKAAGFHCVEHVLPAGEATKSVASLAGLWEAAITAKLDRRAFVVALGGGVVGDLAGFAAASYLRGIDFVQVPTTLLAMVDSAVGGKTGINLPQGKNLVGAFHQPKWVLVDLSVLQTLPRREFCAGMAEVVKYGVIRDAAFFDWLAESVPEILALDPAALRRVVLRSCALKAEVVKADEREGGLRAILNYGHTLGHAIEAVSGYGHWLHGEAIAMGMVYASRLSERVCGLPPAATARQIDLFRRLDLPVSWDGMPWAPLAEAITLDKKAEDAQPRFVLAEALGRVGLPQGVALQLLHEVFQAGAGA